MYRPVPARRGFSLVELLVVVGIIAILIGILLPTLGRARENAKLVQCMSNLRQIGTALKMYSNDYKDRLPDDYTVGGAFFRRAPGDKNPSDPTSLPEKYGLAAVLHGITAQDDVTTALRLKGRYMEGRSKAWICPAARDMMQDFGNTYLAMLLTVKRDDENANRMGNWTSLQRNRPGRERIFYIYDNFANLPFTTGFRRGSTDQNPTLPTNMRAYPHPYRTKNARAINMLYLNGAVGTIVYPPNGNTEFIQG